MQSRTDRIDFPPIDSEELWDGVAVNSFIMSPVPASFRDSDYKFPKTPVISLTPNPSSVRKTGSGNYFRERERDGMVTPARTPSDILFRGPLYVNSSCEEDSNESLHEKDPPVRLNLGPEIVDDLRGDLKSEDESEDNERSEKELRVEYHRERQAAIRKAITEFEKKMTGLLDWHKEREEAIVEEISRAGRMQVSRDC